MISQEDRPIEGGFVIHGGRLFHRRATVGDALNSELENRMSKTKLKKRVHEQLEQLAEALPKEAMKQLKETSRLFHELLKYVPTAGDSSDEGAGLTQQLREARQECESLRRSLGHADERARSLEREVASTKTALAEVNAKYADTLAGRIDGVERMVSEIPAYIICTPNAERCLDVETLDSLIFNMIAEWASTSQTHRSRLERQFDDLNAIAVIGRESPTTDLILIVGTRADRQIRLRW